MANPVSRQINELVHRFGYHPPKTDAKIIAHEDTRALFCGVALEIEKTIPDGREKALAITKIEEAMFWANAAIARDVIQ